MLIVAIQLTQGLAWWIAQARDDDAEPLLARQVGADVEVTRQGGGALSETEEIEVLALLAAHSLRPLSQGEL